MNGLRITWNEEWRHPTESRYGIASKLAIANCILIEVALPWCGGPVPAAPYWEWHASRQIALPEEGGQSSSSGLGASIYEPFYQFSLRFCRKCLEAGFHAVAHQNRLLTTCPAHNTHLEELCPRCHSMLIPTCGEPWTCGYCGFSLALDDVRNWVSAFKQYPGGRFLTWTEAERRAYEFHSDTEFPLLGSTDQFYGDYHYWERNWRVLHLWYLNELFSITRQWFLHHRACFLEHDRLEWTPREGGNQCPVAKTFNYLAQQMYGSVTDGQRPASLTKSTKSAVLLQLVEPLFSKEQAQYLRGQAASLVIRDLAKSNFTSVLNSCLEGNGLQLVVGYKRNWQFSSTTFNVAPSASRSSFKFLSAAADTVCARNA